MLPVFCKEVPFFMKRSLRFLAFMLCLVLLSPAALAVDAPDAGSVSRHSDELSRLLCCGFFTGTDRGLELDRSLTRSEAAVLVVRVMGRACDLPDADIPFADVAGWAAPYVTVLYQSGAVNGVSATRFGANAPVSARQFYTMLLRVLGYSDAHGDFTYETALSFAVTAGLLDESDLPRLETSFVRDDAAYACFRALNASPKGGSEPYARVRARDITNSYSMTAAGIVTGQNRVYDVLAASADAVAALESYTLTQTGTYRLSGRFTDRDDRILTTARIRPAAHEALITIDITDTSGGTTTLERTAAAYSTDTLLAVYSSETDSWDSAALPENLAYHYIGLYDRLFGPDLTYCENFDYAEEDGTAVLTGFLSRFELMADVTSAYDAAYGFDMRIEIDLETMLPESIVCTYRDTWEADGGPLEVDYVSEYRLSGIGSTEIEKELYGLDAYLASLGA